MTSAGLILLVSSVTMAVVGGTTFILARHSAQTSRGILMAIFSHGAFASAGFLFLVTLFPVRSIWPPAIGLESVERALVLDFYCDLAWDCVALTSMIAATIVLMTSAILSQVSSRALLRQCRRRRILEGASQLPVEVLPAGSVLWLVKDPTPDAFATAVLRLSRRTLLRVEDVIVVTTGLTALLSPPELKAALAHEAAHVRARDDRYLPFVNTLATLMFLDPVLRLLSGRLLARYEYGADEDTARVTRDPRSLARAILKVYEHGAPRGLVPGFLGPRGVDPVQRIHRLLVLAEEWGQ